jgi:ribosomal protein S6--L-glutamate ligase
MILSFHPLFAGDRQILCAGREPGAKDLAAIQTAKAVILPQGCPQRLYEMARDTCPNVFPNYDARFRYPGKTGQIRLFREIGAPHPESEIFSTLADFLSRYPGGRYQKLPHVFKFDWGGEGETVFPVRESEQLAALLTHAAEYEKTGQRGFLIQRLVPTGGRSLRVTCIGEHLASYWRVNRRQEGFHTGIAKGAVIDARSDPDLMKRGEHLAASFGRKTGINLAGMDVVFDTAQEPASPLMLEINYFFGRAGMGGSARYYRILCKEIDNWLKKLNIL